jgi:cytochrome c553
MIRPLLIACLTFAAAAAQAAPQDNAATPAAPLAATAPAPAAPAAPAIVGDAARGEQLTYTCQGCHGVTGYKNAYPNYHVPKLGGQAAAYLSNALHEYKTGKRKHPTMQAQAESFTDQDIADIAVYLSGLK